MGICFNIYRRRYSRILPKPSDMLLLCFAFSIIYLVHTKVHETSLKQALGRGQQLNSSHDILIVIKENNNTLKYYPDHKANDYPLSTLPDPYIINSGDTCQHNLNLKFIVIVYSASLNFVKRSIIRDTWGNFSYYNKGEVRIVFILGRPKFERDQKAIADESTLYKDIVQGKFLDTYQNLTHKAVLGIRWVKEHCLHSKMVVKVDDDVVLNLFELFHRMEYGDCCQHPTEIMCNRRPVGDSVIFRSDNDDNKWKIDDEYFPNLKTYPFPYCDGVFFLMAPFVIPVLYEIATHMPYFWIEDVYLTGIVASQSKQIILTNIDGLWPFDYEGIECFQTFGPECVLIAGTSRNSNQFHQMWQLVLQYY